VVGYLLFTDEVREVREERTTALGAVADLQIAQLESWRRERAGDAEYLATGPYNREVVGRLATNPDQPALRAEVVERAQMINRLYGYVTVLLATRDGRVLSGTGERADVLTPSERETAAEAIARGGPVIGNIERFGPAPRDTSIVVAAPMLDSGGRAVAVLLLRRNPQDDILPLVERSPAFSRTAETLLVRRDGNKARYLSRLRHAGDEPLTKLIEVTRKDVVSVQALLAGVSGTIEGRDYRGVDVLAVVRPVSGTGWMLVAKIDRDEILADARYKLRTTALIVALAALLGLVTFLAYFGRRQREYYRELYASERERREAEEETRATLYSIGDAVITTDAAARVRRMNPVAVDLTGWTEQEAKGRPLHEVFRIVDEESRESVANPATRALRDGSVVELAGHVLLLARDGREVPIVDSAAPIRAVAGGDANGVVLVFRDQTREREVQKALERDAQRLRILFDQAQDGIVVIVDGRVGEANPAFAALLGYTPEELSALGVWNLDAELDTREKYFARYPQVLESPGRFDAVMRRKDGSLLNVEISHAPVDWSGRRADFCIVRDMSERVRMQEALSLSEQQFREFAEFVPQLTWMAGANGQITYHNRRWTDYTGLPVADALGAGWLQRIHPDDLPRLRTEWAAAVKNGRPYIEECRLRRSDGEYRWHLARGLPVLEASGRILRWIGYATDIHDMKAARETIERELAERTRDLVAARDQATAANRVKDVFLAAMSHELRTPLNSIIGFTGLLLDGLSGPLTDEQRRQVGIVNQSGQHLLGLISDVLDMSRIESGRLPLDLGPIPLRRLIEEQVQAVETQAGERRLALEAELPEASVIVVGDARRVRQVLNNLLSNAIKYSDRGLITVRARVAGGRVRIEVEDTGIGIPADELPQLFQPFHRLPLPKGAVREGTGLGLAISRRLVTAMGGEIGVRSEPGQGSCFWFTLPLA